MCDSSHVNNLKAFTFHGVGQILLTLSLQPRCYWTVFAHRINSSWLTYNHLKWIYVVMLFLNCHKTDIEGKKLIATFKSFLEILCFYTLQSA